MFTAPHSHNTGGTDIPLSDIIIDCQASVAQWLEHLPDKKGVDGSIPSRRTNPFMYRMTGRLAQLVEHSAYIR